MRATKWTWLVALSMAFVPATSLLAQDRFLLGGTATLAQDPDNSANDVIKIRTDIAPFFGSVSRKANVKIDKLDNMLEFKAWLAAVAADPLGTPRQKTCFGGTPRIQLAIDVNGDGRPDGNAFGYYGDPETLFTACPNDNWMYEDFTGAGDVAITPATCFSCLPSTNRQWPNEEIEWDLHEFDDDIASWVIDPLDPVIPPQPLAPLATATWSQVEDFIKAFKYHKVCSVALVDDARPPDADPLFFEVAQGTAYYDVISLGHATWADPTDLYARGFAMGCGRADHGDDEHDGDDDCDHDHDGDDDKYDRDRRERWHH
jgi:hypothetical protein